jgi:oligopeptide/dipeptide ABC transporter ATP-binding protein
VVGESGSGKSVSAAAIMGLLPASLPVLSGRIGFEGADLLRAGPPALRALRGARIGMIFQEPMTALNPLMRVGAQIAEVMQVHGRPVGGAVPALLEAVGLPDPARLARSYPHRLSGGQRQRVMIAMALALEPAVLIADEPTTALDVTIQAQILDLLRRLQAETGMSMIFITHNLGVVAEIATRVLVMYAGQVVEDAPVGAVLRRPRMPYTAGLIRSVPRLDAVLRRGERLAGVPGHVPDPLHRPAGCTFHPRCGHAQAVPCEAARPELQQVAPSHVASHWVRCARWQEIAV